MMAKGCWVSFWDDETVLEVGSEDLTQLHEHNTKQPTGHSYKWEAMSVTFNKITIKKKTFYEVNNNDTYFMKLKQNHKL